MEFRRETKVHYPAPLLLETMIERMEDIVPFLPNIAAIETVTKKRHCDGTWEIVRRWTANADRVPRVARPFLSDELLQWLDYARWVPAEYKVEWRQEPVYRAASGLYECRGTNFFRPDPEDPENTSCVCISGVLQVYPEKLPGVPAFLARRIAPQVERFIVHLIEPNLLELAKGLEAYLDESKRKGKKRRRPA
ncbi:MAG: hypothetical protein ONB06_06225 [candidate division KSB1 bacterium]|nr:hypothetical protein [candidate division KSB1 bacterium]